MSPFALLSALVVGVTSVHAISSGCQSAFLGIVGSPDAACLNVGGLTAVLTTPANTSYVPALTTWASGMCAAGVCSNETLATIVTNITSACTSDLTSAGLNINPSTAVADVQQWYPTLRKVLCLKDTTNNTLCATNTLNNVQSIIGPLSLGNLVSELPSIMLGMTPNIPKSVTCTDCVKAAYNIIKQDQPAVATESTVTNALTSQCGASFLDGSTPSAIIVGTGSAAASTAKSDGSSLLSRSAWVGVAGSSLAAVSASFALLV